MGEGRLLTVSLLAPSEDFVAIVGVDLLGELSDTVLSVTRVLATRFLLLSIFFVAIIYGLFT